ncbi:hypothetical protein NM208_g13993 [Fusarium decemcellulare]|uniref:Uncharacterized protein n=1 Tax=Fusarium decemcellulare TaxID=57161 RepID=A0ACC1RHP6_9HYPO|nr:hypothetical protein NM208_g13993 [Fusarium decemcellulare]
MTKLFRRPTFAIDNDNWSRALLLSNHNQRNADADTNACVIPLTRGFSSDAVHAASSGAVSKSPAIPTVPIREGLLQPGLWPRCHSRPGSMSSDSTLKSLDDTETGQSSGYDVRAPDSDFRGLFYPSGTSRTEAAN